MAKSTSDNPTQTPMGPRPEWELLADRAETSLKSARKALRDLKRECAALSVSAKTWAAMYESKCAALLAADTENAELRAKAAKWDELKKDSPGVDPKRDILVTQAHYDRLRGKADNWDAEVKTAVECLSDIPQYRADANLGALVRNMPEGAALHHLFEHGDIRWWACSVASSTGGGRATPEEALRAALGESDK